MFYFKDLKTLRIVGRQYQHNLEVIDGKLLEIDPATKCLLLVHVPNKKWSYDVNILEKLDAADGVNRLAPLPQKSDLPQVFYAVVLEQDYAEYVKDYGFRELPSRTKIPKKEPVIKPIPKPNFGDAKTNVGTFSYTPTMVRDGEKTVYRFRNGSEKYK